MVTPPPISLLYITRDPNCVQGYLARNKQPPLENGAAGFVVEGGERARERERRPSTNSGYGRGGVRAVCQRWGLPENRNGDIEQGSGEIELVTPHTHPSIYFQTSPSIFQIGPSIFQSVGYISDRSVYNRGEWERGHRVGSRHTRIRPSIFRPVRLFFSSVLLFLNRSV